jgi:thiol-disulfide isomerase/thioredoxin
MSRYNATARRPISAALVLLATALAAPAFGELKAGDALPDLATFQLEGKLPDALKGQVVLLDFWASWCAPCKSSVPVMQALTEKYAPRGLTVLAVSVDEKRDNMQRFLAAANVSFAVVRDAHHALVAAADIRSMPTSFLIDRAGKVRFVHAGFDGDKTPAEYAREIEQLLREPKP